MDEEPDEGELDEGELERAGLLDGLCGQRRRERVTLLWRLVREGVPLAELRRRSAEGTIMFLLADRVIGGERRYTAAEVAELTGESLDFLTAARRAMGLSIPPAGERDYTTADLEAMGNAAFFRAAGVSEQESLELLRILGRGLSQSAEAIRSLGLRLVLEPGVSEDELAERYALAAAELAPRLGPLITNLLTLHLRHIADSEAISVAERIGGRLPGSREISVCFADLVGFTRLGEEVPPDELASLATGLEEMAGEVAEQPVRLVKTIGDAAMLTSTEPEPLIEAALSLLERADAAGERFPQLRAGIASGAALSRAGDWFGAPVNRASRITQVARPGSLLVEREVREAAGERFRFSYAGERRLRGVREPVALYRARRSEELAGGLTRLSPR
ncbi:MAG: adenylate/guanylate cyclase domain-containing protein [Solirubrobacteraceae bacterium]